MRTLLLIAVLVIATLTGCPSGDKKAAELLDTAGFEEKQHNFEHAGKLYDEIIRLYPGTPAAKDASARLDILKNRTP